MFYKQRILYNFETVYSLNKPLLLITVFQTPLKIIFPHKQPSINSFPVSMSTRVPEARNKKLSLINIGLYDSQAMFSNINLNV